jgi:hypothetical protein
MIGVMPELPRTQSAAKMGRIRWPCDDADVILMLAPASLDGVLSVLVKPGSAMGDGIPSWKMIGNFRRNLDHDYSRCQLENDQQ